MAKTNYIDYAGIKYYDEKLKAWVTAADEKVLSNAKAYADGLATNYDAAGTAQTKVNELANGQVKANKEAIAKLNGGAEDEGSVAKAVADAKAALEASISTVEGKADAAKGAADAAQADVDKLETYVGQIPEGVSATDVIGYINEKTSGIATDAALSKLNAKVAQAEKDIDAIEADYLKAADKTALQEQITANAGAVETEKTRAEGAETALQNNINKKADQSALEAEIARAKAAEEKNAGDIKLILDNPDTEAVDSIKEFVSYIDKHGEVATGLQSQITENKTGLANEVNRATAAETALGERVTTLEGIDHDAYKAADTALKNELTGEINKKANQSTVDAMDAAYKEADTALGARVKVVEDAIGEGGSVTTAIADAKKAGTDAKSYAESVNATVGGLNTRVGANETSISGHAERLTALESKVGEGFVAVTNEQIDALFAKA